MFKYYIDFYISSLFTIEIKATKDFLLSLSFIKSIYAEKINKNHITTKTLLQLGEYFRGLRKKFDLPLYLEGTEFQKKVWNSLIKIPYGETLCYEDIASYIGNVKASRAVGNANNKNKIPIIIPCHRVIGKDNSLKGYGAGQEIKKILLDLEKLNS